MSTDIIKYSQMFLVSLKNGKTITVNQEWSEKFKKAQLEGVIIAYQEIQLDGSLISCIAPIDLKSDISFLSENEKTQIKARSKLFKTRTGKLPSTSVIEKWVAKIQKGENIF